MNPKHHDYPENPHNHDTKTNERVEYTFQKASSYLPDRLASLPPWASSSSLSTKISSDSCMYHAVQKSLFDTVDENGRSKICENLMQHDTDLTNLAIQLTNCQMKRVNMPEFKVFCTENTKSHCLSNLAKNTVAWVSFNEFYSWAGAICIHTSQNIFQEQTQNLINSLVLTADQNLEYAQVVLERQKQLGHAQDKSLNFLENHHDSIHTFLSTANIKQTELLSRTKQTFSRVSSVNQQTRDLHNILLESNKTQNEMLQIQLNSAKSLSTLLTQHERSIKDILLQFDHWKLQFEEWKSTLSQQIVFIYSNYIESTLDLVQNPDNQAELENEFSWWLNCFATIIQFGYYVLFSLILYDVHSFGLLLFSCFILWLLPVSRKIYSLLILICCLAIENLVLSHIFTQENPLFEVQPHNEKTFRSIFRIVSLSIVVSFQFLPLFQSFYKSSDKIHVTQRDLLDLEKRLGKKLEFYAHPASLLLSPKSSLTKHKVVIQLSGQKKRPSQPGFSTRSNEKSISSAAHNIGSLSLSLKDKPNRYISSRNYHSPLYKSLSINESHQNIRFSRAQSCPPF